jgi:glutamate/tyrosine decarboxylase-like PLP-dependent enzyme
VSDHHTRPALLDADHTSLLHQAVDLGLDFASGRLRENLVLRHATPAELIKRLAGPLPRRGVESDQELVDLLTEVASWSVSQADPRYLAFPDTGNSAAGLAAEILAAFLNQNLIAFDRSAPAASVIEAQLIVWLREVIGFDAPPLTDYQGLRSLGGMWTSGGNMSNHTALTVALAHAFPQVRQSGLRSLPERPLILLASGVEHFSYLSAAQSLGLGEESLLWAPPRSDFTSDPDALAALLENPPDGSRIVMLVGVAGNCRTTGIDDLEALADLCERHGVWFHVDACHGGSLLFSPRLRQPLTGIERADSVALDPHKGLFVTYPSSYVLFRDPTTLGNLARYPERADDPGCLDLGLITPFYGSRGFESLKLWALLQHQGTEGIARLVESRHATYLRMTAMLERVGCFKALGTSDFYRHAFVFLPPPAAQLLTQLRDQEVATPQLRAVVSRFTGEFSERLYRSGLAAFDHFALLDLADRIGLGPDMKYEVMGMCVGHPDIDASTEAAVESELRHLAAELTVAMLEALRSLAPGQGPAAEPPDEPAAPDGQLGPAGW